MRTSHILASLPLTACIAGASLGETKTFEFKGTTQTYLLEQAPEDGATPIVLVHGWCGSRTLWHKQIAELSKTRTVLAVDLPGNGDSEDVDAEHSMDLYAHAIAAAMDDAGIESAVVVGHSNGVPTIRQFYRNYSDRVVALVAVDGPLFNMRPDGIPEQIMSKLESDGYKEVVTQMFAGMQSTMIHPEDVDLVHEVMLATSQDVIVGGLKAGADPAIWVDDQIDRPLLVLNAQSPWWTDNVVERIEGLAESSDVQIWEGVSHFLFLDDPDRFNEAVRTFLAAHDR